LLVKEKVVKSSSSEGSLLESYLMTCRMMNKTTATVTTHRAAVDTMRQKSRLRRSLFQKLRRWERDLPNRSGVGCGGTGTALDMPSHITVFPRGWQVLNASPFVALQGPLLPRRWFFGLQKSACAAGLLGGKINTTGAAKSKSSVM
jgi:hypothetical protein